MVTQQLAPLLEVLTCTDVEEVLIEHQGLRLHVRQTLGTATHAVVEPQPEEAPQPELHTVLSGMVGVFYRGRGPDEAPVVQEGASVSEGQLIGYTQVLNMFNEVHTPYAGTLTRFLVESGHPVEYGQPLALVEPVKRDETSDIE